MMDNIYADNSLFGTISSINPEENRLVIGSHLYQFNPGKINVRVLNRKVDMENLKPNMSVEYKIQNNNIYFVKILNVDRQANHYNLQQ